MSQETWLDFKQKLETRFPFFRDKLNPGAAITELEALEHKIQETLPESFRDLYLQNDGETQDAHGYIFGLKLLPLQEINIEIEGWNTIIEDGLDGLNDFCESRSEGAIKCIYANRKWLPFLYDWGGNHIGIDFDPGISGTKSQIINFGRDEDIKYVFAASFDQFLELICRLLDQTDEVYFNENNYYSFRNAHFIDALKNLYEEEKINSLQ